MAELPPQICMAALLLQLGLAVLLLRLGMAVLQLQRLGTAVLLLLRLGPAALKRVVLQFSAASIRSCVFHFKFARGSELQQQGQQ